MFQDLGTPLIVLRLPSSHLYFAEHFEYWAHDFDFELRLHCHTRRIFPGWQIVILLASSPSHLQGHYMNTPSLFKDCEGSPLFYFQTPSVSAYYFSYIFKPHPGQDLVCRVATSEFMVCSFNSFLGLACAGSNLYDPDECCELYVNTGISMKLLPRLHCGIEQYNVLQFLSKIGIIGTSYFSLIAVLDKVDWS